MVTGSRHSWSASLWVLLARLLGAVLSINAVTMACPVKAVFNGQLAVVTPDRVVDHVVGMNGGIYRANNTENAIG